MPFDPPRQLGVCSWSLRARDPAELVERVRAAGVRCIQLALDPFREFRWRADDAGSRLRAAGIRIASGMMAFKGEDYSTLESIRATGGLRLDEHWEENLRAAEANAVFAQRFAMPLVTFHAGFLPESPDDPLRAVLLDRLGRVVAAFRARNVRVALETGQETAETLLGVLDSLPGVGVNFDPANMILYGMGDPVAAFRLLARRVLQVHVKDALPASRPGEWGTEVPVGRGAVDWPAFLAAVRDLRPGIDLMIERESGDDRIADAAAARELVLGELLTRQEAVA